MNNLLLIELMKYVAHKPICFFCELHVTLILKSVQGIMK